MPAGSTAFKISDLHINEAGAEIGCSANITKWIEDDAGAVHSLGSWVAHLSYARSGFGARTVASIRTDLIAEAKAKHTALSGKTVS